MTANGWAHPELLVDTDWLAGHLDDPNLVVVDCDLLPAYQRLHIPKAIAARSRYWKGDGNDTDIFGIEGDKFAELLGKMGISNDDTIVAYDGSGGVFAARFWWTLDRYGHAGCKLLDGGLDQWYADGRPLSNENIRPKPTTYTPLRRTTTGPAPSTTSPQASATRARSSGTSAPTASGRAPTPAAPSAAATSPPPSISNGWTTSTTRSARLSRPPRFASNSPASVSPRTSASAPIDRAASVRRTDCLSSGSSATTTSASTTLPGTSTATPSITRSRRKPRPRDERRGIA